MVQWKTLVEEEKSCFLLVMVKKKKRLIIFIQSYNYKANTRIAKHD